MFEILRFSLLSIIFDNSFINNIINIILHSVASSLIYIVFRNGILLVSISTN